MSPIVTTNSSPAGRIRRVRGPSSGGGGAWDGTGLPAGDHILYAHDFSGGDLVSTAYSGTVAGTGSNGGATQTVEADGTARSGYAMKCNWDNKSGANSNQAVFYEYNFSAADIAKITAAGGVLHMGMRFKFGTSAYADANIQKIMRPQWLRSVGASPCFQSTVDAANGHWIAAGAEILPDQSNLWSPFGNANQAGLTAPEIASVNALKPSTLQNTYRYIEWRVEVGTSGTFKCKLWVDGTVALDSTKTGLTAATFTALRAYFWDTYNNSNETRTDTTDFVAVATDYIGVPV